MGHQSSRRSHPRQVHFSSTSRSLSTIRFAHQPGLILRSGREPASVETVWEENTGKDEWTLARRSSASSRRNDRARLLDARRARHEQTARKSPAAGDVAAGSVRRLPRLQPIGVERYSGSLGVRRPGDWTGRFDPIPDTEPISDESFVKSWGNLPEEPLTLCGTSRFVRDCRASLLDRPGSDEDSGQAHGSTPARIRANRDDRRGRALRAFRSSATNRSSASRGYSRSSR